MSRVILHDYWRSTASYRVRIALNLAGIDYEKRSVDLLKGEQRSAGHLELNPQGLVPVLEIDGSRLTQSLAIIEYLNETRDLNLLPDDPVDRAQMRSLAQIICCDTHPVCNLSVVSFALRNEPNREARRSDWMQHFIRSGLEAFDTALGDVALDPFTNDKRIGLPEISLIPQLYNADRWNVAYDDLAKIQHLERHCIDIGSFADAKPEIPDH